jgi:hypothetical protein
MASHRALKAAGPAVQAEAERQPDAGLRLLVDILKRKRERTRVALTTLAKRAGVAVETIERFEAYDLRSVGLPDLLSIATALGSKLSVQLGPIKPRLPTTNSEILREFDRLIKTRHCSPFLRDLPDKKHPDVLWDVVGDKERNWLFVVVRHGERKGQRFGLVTAEPGGWRIAGQIFGMDVETEAIARKMSHRLFQLRRDELVSRPRRKTRVNTKASRQS